MAASSAYAAEDDGPVSCSETDVIGGSVMMRLKECGAVTCIAVMLTTLSAEAYPGTRQCEANELEKLTPSDGIPGDNFGGSGGVAMQGDTVVVGAERHDDCAANAGVAYVFCNDGSSWAQTQELLPSDCPAGGFFGHATAIDNDIIVVGATVSNSAYVFRRDNNGTPGIPCDDQWIEQATLLSENGGGGFGVWVAISGNTIVVGAFTEDSNTGSVYVFEEPEGGWASVPSPIHETAKLRSCDASADWLFGNSVDICGETIVIGALVANVNGNNDGAAYVFKKGVGWADGCANQVARLHACDGSSGDLFGYPVACSSDTLLIGAYTDDAGAGSAYLFEKGSAWADGCTNQVAKLVASDREPQDGFGHDADLSGDVAIIGAVKDDSRTGSIYVVAKPPGGWASIPSPICEDAKLVASDGQPGDEMGRVAASGNSALAGANVANAAYFFSGLSDCNDAGTLDVCKLETSASTDCNNNGLPDECESDCNNNGVADECDLADGSSTDCQPNAVPDECEVDSDNDGVIDECDPCPNDNPDDTDNDGVCDSNDICLHFDDSVDEDDDGTPDGCDDCPTDSDKTVPGVCGCGVADVDTDEDGTADCIDACSDSDVRATIVIDGCDAEVANHLFSDGCTMLDLIHHCADSATNHGTFVNCVGPLTNSWKHDGLITGREKGQIQSCTAQSDIGHGCSSDADCDDGTFCNGVEMCLDGDCVTGDPCPAQECDEEMDQCFD